MSALLLLLSIAQAGVLDRVAAVVNGEVITLSEIYDQGEAYISQQCGGVPSCVYERELEVLDELKSVCRFCTDQMVPINL